MQLSDMVCIQNVITPLACRTVSSKCYNDVALYTFRCPCKMSHTKLLIGCQNSSLYFLSTYTCTSIDTIIHHSSSDLSIIMIYEYDFIVFCIEYGISSLFTHMHLLLHSVPRGTTVFTITQLHIPSYNSSFFLHGVWNFTTPFTQTYLTLRGDMKWVCYAHTQTLDEDQLAICNHCRQPIVIVVWPDVWSGDL